MPARAPARLETRKLERPLPDDGAFDVPIHAGMILIPVVLLGVGIGLGSRLLDSGSAGPIADAGPHHGRPPATIVAPVGALR